MQTAGVLEQCVFSLSLGFALISYLLFGLGSLGWLSLTMALAVLTCAALLGLPSWSRLVAWLRVEGRIDDLNSRLRQLRYVPHVVVFSSLIIVTALLNLIGASAPPTEWDSLDHHLGAVKYFIDHGRISFLPYRAWQAPFTAEMWNMLGLLLGSDRLPQLFQWAMGLASATAFYVLVAGRTSRRTALLAVTLYYTSPHILYLSTSAKSDLVWLTFLFLSLHSLLVWQERDDLRWFWLSAVLTGLVLGTKFQGLFWAGSIGLVVLVLQGVNWRHAFAASMTRTVAYGAIAALLVSPWWLRNWWAGGDPIWPYGYPLFHSRFWTQELYDKYAAWTQGPGDSLWYYVTGLWNLTVHQSAWPNGLSVAITPVLLAFVPGLTIAWPHVPVHTRRFFGVLFVLIGLYYTFWFTTYQKPRYLLPSMALLMIPAAYVFYQMMRLYWLRLTATGLLVSSLILFLGYNVAFNLQFTPVVFGFESRDSFLTRKVSFFEDIEWLNQNLPTRSRILFFHLKSFYLQRDFIRGDRNIWPVDEETSPEEYLNLLQERGITHIFYTGIYQKDPEYFFVAELLARLKDRENLVTIYINRGAVQIISRTLARSRRTTVEVLEVVPF